MNREHKFKAWDEQSKTMHIPMTLQQIKHVLVAGSAGETGTAGSIFCVTFNDLIFLEFTGFKDKNGKEIYEGDIVLVEELEFEGYYNDGNPDSPGEKYSDCKGKVFYEGAGFSFDGHSAGTIPLDYVDIEKIQVIGNIYQNPELLK